jgi:transposase
MSLLQRKDVEGNGAAGRAALSGVPDPELIERPRRRRFSAEYKLRILREADGLSLPGAVGALLRREALYSSHLSTWRRQRDEGTLEAFSRPRGRKPADPLLLENAQLRHRAESAETELEKARRVIEVQGNVCALLGELVEPRGAQPNESSER